MAVKNFMRLSCLGRALPKNLISHRLEALPLQPVALEGIHLLPHPKTCFKRDRTSSLLHSVPIREDTQFQFGNNQGIAEVSRMKRALTLLLAYGLVCQPALAGIPKDKAQYSGGTVTSIPAGAIGPLVTTDPQNLLFQWGKEGKNGAGSWSVPYTKITSLAYGQHAGRRVGSAIAWGATTLGIMALPILLSKKRRHYLTIEWKDSGGKEQAAIFQVGKEAICPALTVLEVRSGQKVQYESEEAREAGCH